MELGQKNDILFLTTFTQLTAKLNKFLMDWFLVLFLKECLVECELKVWSYYLQS